jgi:Xaa-Pro dipeptidase
LKRLTTQNTDIITSVEKLIDIIIGGIMTKTARMLARLNKVSDILQKSGLNALVLNPGPSLTYFTGLHFHLSERPVVVFLQAGMQPIIVLPELEKAKIEDLIYEVSAFSYGEDPTNWSNVFQQAASELNSQKGKVGVESRLLRFLELQLLKGAMPQFDFLPADNLIASLRMFKDSDEIKDMQRAVDIAQNALLETLPFIQPGKTEKQIAAELSIQLMRHGSNPQLPFFPIVSGGPNSANPHAAPSDRPLSHGDLLVIDYGANVNGYFSDITRTFAIGEVSPECHKIAEIVLEANRKGRGATRPGNTASMVDAAARSLIEATGYGEHFIHRTGHGLGLEVHEDPYIRRDNELVLQEGMTFTIEPGIYLPNRFGVRIEDNVAVISEGVRCLTSLPRNLVMLPIG